LNEKADAKPNFKQHKKPTIDISDIEKSIDAIIKEKTQKTPQKPTPIPKSEQTPQTINQNTQEIQPPSKTIPPKYHLTPEEKKTAALERIPLLEKEQQTPPTEITQPNETKKQKIETKEQYSPSLEQTDNTQLKHPQEDTAIQKPPTTPTQPQKILPQTNNFPHPQDKSTPPQLNTSQFTPNANKRPSIYAVKKKPQKTTTKKPFHLPHIPNLFKKIPKKSPQARTQPKTEPLPTQQKEIKKQPKQPLLKQLTKKPLTTKKKEIPQKSKEKKPLFSTLKLTKTSKGKKTQPISTLPHPIDQITSQKTAHPELHDSLQKLSSNESSWLDQKIQENRNTNIHPQDLPEHLQGPKKGKFSKTNLLKGFRKSKTTSKSTSTTDYFQSNQTTPSSLQTIPKQDTTKSFTNLFQKNQQPKSNIPYTFQDQQQKTFKELFIKPKEPEPSKEHIYETKPELSLPDIKPQKSKIQDINQLKTILLEDLGYKEGSCEELDFYPLIEPFSYVEIIREKKTLDKRYVLIEIDLTDQEREILDFIRISLNSINVDAKELELKGDREYLKSQVEQIIEDYMLKLDDAVKRKIIFYIEKQFLGLEKLEVLMRDPNIEDISCDGSRVPIFLYHRRFGSLRSNVEFETEEELASFVIKLAQKCGKHISIAEPMLDATMPDGSRIQMTLSTEITTKGSTFTIRKFMEDPFSPPDLIEFNTMSSEMVAYMWMAVENGINALIAGGTAAGKTSALNALALFIPRESKIVSIEETREINLPHPNWIPGVSRSGFGEVVGNKVMGEIDLYDLMKAALRQRPEYILVGEIRGKEAYVLFQAMATGHTTYSTVHADSAQSLIHRLEGKPINIPRIMLQALDVVCIQIISRVKNKRARRCKQIIEIIDIDPTTKEILTNEVFHWDPVEDKFVYSGKSYVLERIRAEKDLTRDDMSKELSNRSLLLEWMNEQNIREFKKVATLIAQYVDNPEEIMKKLG
jgi:flagellar protein FlaI